MKFRWFYIIAAFFLGLVTTTTAQTGILPAIDFDGSAGSRGDGPFMVGNLFTVGSVSLQVSALGVQDYGGAGVANTDGFFNSPRDVGLWNAAGTSLLARASVTSTDPLTGTYRYASITPIVLSANTQYLIGALVGAGYEWFGDSFTAASYSGSPGLITLGPSRFASGGSFTAPLQDGNTSGAVTGRWAPANMLVVPEPSALSLFAVGLVGVVLRRRRRTG